MPGFGGGTGFDVERDRLKFCSGLGLGSVFGGRTGFDKERTGAAFCPDSRISFGSKLWHTLFGLEAADGTVAWSSDKPMNSINYCKMNQMCLFYRKLKYND